MFFKTKEENNRLKMIKEEIRKKQEFLAPIKEMVYKAQNNLNTGVDLKTAERMMNEKAITSEHFNEIKNAIQSLNIIVEFQTPMIEKLEKEIADLKKQI